MMIATRRSNNVINLDNDITTRNDEQCCLKVMEKARCSSVRRKTRVFVGVVHLVGKTLVANVLVPKSLVTSFSCEFTAFVVSIDGGDY